MADTVSFLNQSCLPWWPRRQLQDQDQDTKPVTRLSWGEILSWDVMSPCQST